MHYLPCWKFELLPDEVAKKYMRSHNRFKIVENLGTQLQFDVFSETLA